MKAFKPILPLLGAALLLLAFFRALAPAFLSGSNLLDLAQQISVNAILAFGMTLVILSGGIDLSVGALLALGGTAAAAILPTGGFFAALAAGIGVGALFGLGNGLVAARTRIP